MFSDRSLQAFENELEQILSTTKLAAELTEASRSSLPKKDFAVSAKKSNTGKPAYPIEDRKHAISALGFSKMHGDSGDAAEVKKDVARKYPDLVKEKDSQGMSMGPATGPQGGMQGGMGGLPGVINTKTGSIKEAISASKITGAIGSAVSKGAPASRIGEHFNKLQGFKDRAAGAFSRGGSESGLTHSLGTAGKINEGMRNAGKSPSVVPSLASSLKLAGVAGALGKALGPASSVGQHLAEHSHAYDLAGLGVLAAPSLHNLGQAAKAKVQGGPVDRKEVGHSLAEVGGLGILAAPVAAQMMRGH